MRLEPEEVRRALGPTGDERLEQVRDELVACTRCPRLVEWREASAAAPPKRFEGERYWARPVLSFGDARARIAVVGLAPAAHGGNRTARIFTGDRSGDWLFAAMDRAGLASQPESVSAADGLRLRGAWVTAVVNCAPPANRPTVDERDACLGYLVRELAALDELAVIVALGSFAWDGALRALRELGLAIPKPRPRFGHAAIAEIGSLALIGSYHPSQQNTFTGKLTEPMLDQVFELAKQRAWGQTP